MDCNLSLIKYFHEDYSVAVCLDSGSGDEDYSNTEYGDYETKINGYYGETGFMDAENYDYNMHKCLSSSAVNAPNGNSNCPSVTSPWEHAVTISPVGANYTPQEQWANYLGLNYANGTPSVVVALAWNEFSDPDSSLS